jgi:RNA polymerase sigma factor (sigma-70 family)
MAIETLGAALRQLTGLFAGGVVAGLSDAQLLERFLTRGDAAAFEVLLGRHGPMVLGVCRGILRDPHDAEDAFQATFLVLVQKGGTIRGRDSLGGWLHQVAHRVANRANVAAARRARRERQVREMAVATSTNGPAAPDDLLPALHEEIARLPEKYRLAVVHCDLEGMTQAEAAGRLHWSERTIRSRLAEGRARLRRRLARRGLEPDGVTLGAVLLREARAAVPAAWREATLRAALAATHRTMAVGAGSAAAQQLAREVSTVMLIHKLTLASAALLAAGLIAWGASAARVSPGPEGPKGAADAAAPQPAPGPDDTAGTVPVRGRVLDPDGKPVAGAEIYVRHYAEKLWRPVDPMAARQKGRVAVADADGRFLFELDKGASDVPYDGGPRWRKAQIAAAAPGFAPAWVEAGDVVKRGEVALRLVRDAVPVRGRVLDSQGRPVAGVVVRIAWIREVKDGGDLDAMLASGELDENQVARWYGLGQRHPTWQADPSPLWPGGRNAWTTGADGRFEVPGIGRDRIARLDFHGGGVADGTLDVMARVAKSPPKPRRRPGLDPVMQSLGRDAAFRGRFPQGTQLVGATFDYIAGPTKPIAGIVRLKGSGEPVEGAVIRGADPTTHTTVVARTDAAGRFRLDGVPKAEFYQLMLTPRPGIDPFLGHQVIMDDTEGLKPLEAVIEVPIGVIVKARLIDKETGRAVPPGAIMYIKAPSNVGPDDAALGVSRLGDATFGLTVPPGLGMIIAAASVSEEDDPYACAHLRPADRGKGIGDTGSDETFRTPLSGYHTYRYIDPPAGAGPVVVDLELARGLSREGRLVGPDGRPIVGTMAYGLCARWGNVQTLDRASTFEVRGLEPGHPRLLIFTHKDRKIVGSVVLKDEDMKSTTPLEVKLVPAGAVTGRVVDEDGQPLAGARLHVMMYERNRRTNLPQSPRSFWPCDEPFTADAQGRFRVEGFVPGVAADVSVTDANAVESLIYRPSLDTGDIFRNLVVEPGEVRDLGDVKATPRRPQ